MTVGTVEAPEATGAAESFDAIGEEVESLPAVPTVEEVEADLGANDPEPDREADPDGWRKWSERRRKRRQRARATVDKLIAEREQSGAMDPADAEAARASAKRTAGRRKRAPRASVSGPAPASGPSEGDRIRSAIELCKIVARGSLALADATGYIKSQPGDADTLGEVWGPVAEPYLREDGGNTPLIAAVIVTGQVLIVRFLDAKAERARALPPGYTEEAPPSAPDRPVAESQGIPADFSPLPTQPGAVPGYTPAD